MFRRMIPVAGSRFSHIELTFQSDAEAAEWAKGLPMDGQPVHVAWNGRTVTLTPAALRKTEAEAEEKAEPSPLIAELAALSDPDLDTRRAELGLKRVKGETREELVKRMAEAIAGQHPDPAKQS